MNRYIYSFIAAVLATITIVSCNDARKSETFRVLEDIEKSELSSKELEAKYALLLSQALDKNYIDLQSDSIIAILCAIKSSTSFANSSKSEQQRRKSWRSKRRDMNSCMPMLLLNVMH